MYPEGRSLKIRDVLVIFVELLTIMTFVAAVIVVSISWVSHMKSVRVAWLVISV